MSLVLNGTTGISGTNALTGVTGVNSGQIGGSRNKIINGAMVIDQRNVGASVTPTNGGYQIDRYQTFTENSDGVFTVQRVADAPAGFINSAKITVTTADASIGASQRYLFLQNIEGFNVSDLGFGAAEASAVTVSFWVKASVTGASGGSLSNAAFNRTYPFSYTINSASTWEHKKITIAGDTSGTWSTDNSVGLRVMFGIGVGSSNSGSANAWAGAGYYQPTGAVNLISTLNATLNITGVQLEKGSTATEFEHRSYGEELALCQRYLYKSIGTQAYNAHGLGSVFAANQVDFITSYPVQMRANATASFGGTVSAAKGTTEVNISSISDVGGSTFNSFLRCTLAASSFTIGDCLTINNNNDATGYIQFDAEL